MQIHAQAVLPACHRKIHLGQQLRVKQSAVQGAVRIRYPVALAQRVEGIALAGMKLFCLQQRIRDRTHMLLEFRQAEFFKFCIEEANIEWRVVNNDLCIPQVVAQRSGDVGEFGFVA